MSNWRNMMNWPLFALALSAFGIGTTEFVIMGLLPNIAHDLNVSVSNAGLLVAGYALAVAIGAPIMALLTARLPRRSALLTLMGLFIVGNVLCALSANYALLMTARAVTALCHGAFFGLGSAEAADMAPADRKASSVALMFTGLTLANVLGVPLGTALGQQEGWRATFWVVSIIGFIALGALALFLPKDDPADRPAPNYRRELTAVISPQVAVALGMTVLFSASMFALFTYIAPVLDQLTHLSPHGISATLLVIGVSLTIGNLVGGRLADWNIGTARLAFTALAGIAALVFYWADHAILPAEVVVFAWGLVSFAAASILQVTALNAGRSAPGLIATLNIGAFNVGNAIGAWAGGLVVASRFGLAATPLLAAAFSAAGTVLTIVAMRTVIQAVHTVRSESTDDVTAPFPV